MKVVFRPAARRDVLLQVGYYLEQQALDAAERFPNAVAEAVTMIARHPEAGALRQFSNSKLAGLRSWPVPGFDEIRVYYMRPESNLVRIVRVLHGKRDLEQFFGD